MAPSPRRSPPKRELATPSVLPAEPRGDRLLPAELGHVATGTEPPRAVPTWIEDHLPRVEEAFRWTGQTGRECGFLAYFADAAGKDLELEATSRGTRTEISWKWAHTDATVAFTFHTHPGDASIAMPSGLDVLGATVRGDHVHYILDMHGRLVGWRFRDPRDWPRATQEAMRALADGHQLDRRFVAFLTEALEALMPRLMEPCYGAKVTLLDGAMLLTREDPRRLLSQRAP